MTSAGQALSVEPATTGPKFLTRVLGPLAVALALLSALATFVVLSGLTPIVPTDRVVDTLHFVTAATVLLLVGVIAREIWQIVQARRTGRAAARLHVRIIGLFSVIAAVPTILVAVVASLTLDRGLDRLFSEDTRAVIRNSIMVADAYVAEQQRTIRGDSLVMALELARAKPLFDQDRERFRQFLAALASVRGTAVAMMLDEEAKVIERVNLDVPNFDVNQTFVMPSRDDLAGVPDAEPQVGLLPNYVAAAVRLRNYENTFLYVVRPFDPRVVAQLQATQADVTGYASLEARRLSVQLGYALMYTVIALIVLLCAMWIGLSFANRLVEPIRRLIGAANLVSTGNLHVQVPIGRSEGDLANLGETFNKMTRELRSQRDDIVNARDLIDSRRRFTEAVLAGASAGVIGVDHDGNISILNRSAERLIGSPGSEVLGRPLAEIVPELADIMRTAQSGTQRLVQGQVTINRGGRERNLSVRVTGEQSAEAEHGYVVTLDDITELVIAQRTSAWADVARRIAHEIKNPLTPIQLSAERLRRKYGGVIHEDRGVFEQCTETIVRQVDDIKRMVDEFSRFARMPKPVMTAEDVAETVRQAVFLMKVGHSEIDFIVDIAEDPMPARFDRRLISQALTNVIKNAAEAIAAVPPAQLGHGRIQVSAERDGDEVIIDVIDNGIGLPVEHRNRLLEPYVTTREKGTGLGLAIVGRILEDHGGRIELGDAADKIPGQTRGAWLRLRFKAEPVTEAIEPEMRKTASER
jgi:two-component system nitrogen regulation sensor histidine kinase NtrY